MKKKTHNMTTSWTKIKTENMKIKMIQIYSSILTSK